jgi:hypothetical protein
MTSGLIVLEVANLTIQERLQRAAHAELVRAALASSPTRSPLSARLAAGLLRVAARLDPSVSTDLRANFACEPCLAAASESR